MNAITKTAAASFAGALLAVSLGATADAAPSHVSPGCKVVSTTTSAPAYSSVTDRTGMVTVVTVTKCRGKVTTSTSSSTVSR